MSAPVETYTHAGLTVEIHYDEDPVNPRTNFDHVATIVQLNEPRSGSWGDVTAEFDGTMTCPLCDGYGESETRFELVRGRWFGRIVGAGSWDAMEGEARDSELSVRHAPCPRCNGEQTVAATLAEYVVQEYGRGAVWLPIDHWDDWRPALKVSTDRTVTVDQSPDGFIVCDAETAEKEWDTREECENYLRAEVTEYSQYLQGDVYGYVVKDADGEEFENVGTGAGMIPLDVSCWGFIGELDYVRGEANTAAESVAESLAAEQVEREAMAARDIVTE